MAEKAASSSDADPWYCHPVYARYWQHYHQAMAWLQNHHHAYRKAMESYFNSLWYFSSVVFPQNYYADQGGYPEPFYKQHPDPRDASQMFQHSEGSGQLSPDNRWNQASAKKGKTWSSEEQTESESDGEILCDVSNMEITEELRQYFAETEKHREERRRQQQLDAERLREYVNADHDLYYNVHRTVEPPTERPGERRQAEMKKLYGDSAAKIMAMEASIQLNFNKHCDRKQPKYWPVIPLKF